MKALLPIPVDKFRPIRRAGDLRGLSILLSELARRPSQMFSILRRFKRLQRGIKILLEGAKIMQFGGKGKQGDLKLSVYVPHWPSTAAELRIRRSLRSDSLSPELVTLSITDRCPYKCLHCSNTRAQSQPLPQSRLVEVVREIQDMGGSWLNIGGGEPGLVFERSLAVVAAAGKRSETWLNTTGFALDDDKAKILKEAGLFGGRVSIHSHKPNEHDAFVGYAGAFKIAVEAVQIFRRADIFPIISAALPEDQIVWDRVYELLRMGQDLGAGLVEIIPIRPAGRTLIACNHNMLGRTKVHQQMFQTFNIDSRFAKLPAVDGSNYWESPERFGCLAGSGRLYISASGDVQPCPLVNLSLGNVLENSLASVYESMRELLPGPRAEALCCELSPAVSEYVGEAGRGCDELPIPPEISSQILAGLAMPKTPRAWA